MKKIAKFLKANIVNELNDEIKHSTDVFDKSYRLNEIIQFGITPGKIEEYRKKHPEDT